MNCCDILLVEDDPKDIELINHALKNDKINYLIQIATDGEEALDYLFCRGNYSNRRTKPKPRLILMDLKLPKVDGFEVLERIKNDPATRSIPVVILTSSIHEKDIGKGYQLGANSYIEKPVNFDTFAITIKDISRYWLEMNQSIRQDTVEEPEEATE